MNLEVITELKFKDGKTDEKIITFRGKKLGSISINGLALFLSHFIDQDVLTKARSFSTDVNESLDSSDIKIKNLINCYFNEKQKFYENKNISIKKIPKNSKDYSFFKTAQSMLDEHNVSPEDFLKSQLRVFKLLNNGIGVFPKPNQLVTPEAESRLLQYLKETKDQRELDISFSKWELDTPLNENPKFKAYYRRLLNDPHLVTDKEVKYIELLIEARDQEMPPQIAELILARKRVKGVLNV